MIQGDTKDIIAAKRVKWLDSLRGIACLIVMVAHVLASIPTVGVRVSGCGKIGVWLFFVLSGFWVCYPYCTSKKTFVIGDTWVFYLKRVLRIYPMYILTLAIAVWGGYMDMDWQMCLKHVLLLQGFGHFWAIPVEMKYYMIVPLILCVCSRLTKKKSLVLLLCIAVAVAVAFPYTTYIENSICLIWYIPVFLMGMCTAYVYNCIKNKRTFIYFDGIVVACFLIMFLLVPGVREYVFGIQPDSYLQNKYLYIAVIWILLLLSVGRSKHVLVFLENNKFLAWIGKISYSVYLIHYIVLYYVGLYVGNGWIKMAVVVPTSIFLAAGTEFIIERRGIAVGKRIAVKNKEIKSKKRIVVICVLLNILGIAYVIVGECYSFKEEHDNVVISEKDTEEIIVSENEWRDRLYVPTMIQKCGETYFIIDCWNSRILYSEVCSDDLNDWKTLQDDAYLGGHSVASDGELYVFDNTDMNQILVYVKDGKEFKQSQIIEGIETRPHYVIYDEDTQKFYVIGSTSGTIYILSNESGTLALEQKCQMEELQGAYVRSISVIDGELYTVSGSGKIRQYIIKKNGFELKEEYEVPDKYFGMNQISKIGGYWFFTINTDKEGNVDKTTIVCAESINALATGNETDLYDMFGFTGQPYFITSFDNRYYITEISELGGNGILSFDLKDGMPHDIQTLFYWETASEASKERWKQQKEKYSGQVVDLVIFMGQSNMSGKGDATQAPNVKKGWEFRAITDTSQLYPITEPFGLKENNPSGIDDTTETGEFRKMGGWYLPLQIVITKKPECRSLA